MCHRRYTTIAELHHIVDKYAATILHTPIDALAPDGVNVAGEEVKAGTTYQVTLNGTAGDDPITFVVNEGDNTTTVSVGGKDYPMTPSSVRIFDQTLQPLWYSQPDAIDGEGEPYHNALSTPLKWSTWKNENKSASDAKGTWYGTTFSLDPSLPAGAQVSVNLTGFGQGNLFLNGVHVAYFNIEDGSCASPPGGVNGHGSCLGYVESRCGKPTQDTYHVPPEWLVKPSAAAAPHGGKITTAAAVNEMMVWSDPKLPNNVTQIDPALVSVVYRVDPPKLRSQIDDFLAAHA